MELAKIFTADYNPLIDKWKYEGVLLDAIFKNAYGSLIECPNCLIPNPQFKKIQTRRSYQCPSCSHQLYPTSGTIFEKTTTPLIIWFYKAHLFINRIKTTIRGFEKQTGVSYKTAWRIHHLVKNAVIRGESIAQIYRMDISESEIQSEEPMKEIIKEDNLPERKWLLSNDDFDELCGLKPNMDLNDWTLNVLWDNGITSPEDGQNKFHTARFEYSNPDCTFCGEIDEHYVLNTGQWRCKKCSKKFSLTSNTALDNTKLEYYIWWRFAYLVGGMKITNSCTIAKDLGISQKSAWGMIRTLRRARKQFEDKKFINGSEVLSFNHAYEIVDLLIKRKKNSTSDEDPKEVPEPLPEPLPEPVPELISESLPAPELLPDPQPENEPQAEIIELIKKKGESPKEAEAIKTVTPSENIKRNKVLDFLNLK